MCVCVCVRVCVCVCVATQKHDSIVLESANKSGTILSQIRQVIGFKFIPLF